MDRKILFASAVAMALAVILAVLWRPGNPQYNNTTESQEEIEVFRVNITRNGFVPGRVECMGGCVIVFMASDVPHNIKIGGIEKYLQVGEEFRFALSGNATAVSDSYDGSGKMHRFSAVVKG